MRTLGDTINLTQPNIFKGQFGVEGNSLFHEDVNVIASVAKEQHNAPVVGV